MSKTPKYTYGVYVIELNSNPNHVYVGQSSYPPEQRLQQHLSGSLKRHAAKVFRRGATGKLRPDLYAYIKRFKTSDEAMTMEFLLAQDLRQEGFKVEGGH